MHWLTAKAVRPPKSRSSRPATLPRKQQMLHLRLQRTARRQRLPLQRLLPPPPPLATLPPKRKGAGGARRRATQATLLRERGGIEGARMCKAVVVFGGGFARRGTLLHKMVFAVWARSVNKASALLALHVLQAAANS
jgi:hypothetical protein